MSNDAGLCKKQNVLQIMLHHSILFNVGHAPAFTVTVQELGRMLKMNKNAYAQKNVEMQKHQK